MYRVMYAGVKEEDSSRFTSTITGLDQWTGLVMLPSKEPDTVQ